MQLFLHIIPLDHKVGEDRSDEVLKLLSSPVMMEFSVKDCFATSLSPLSILPILSTPFEILCHQRENQLTLTRNYFFDLKDISPMLLEFPMSCVRPIDILNRSRTVYAYESPGQLGIGGKIWDSTFILINYLSEHAKSIIEDEIIVELGSGTGITGKFSLEASFSRSR